MECPFGIWLARNIKEWTVTATSCKLNDSSKESCNSPCSMSSVKQTTKRVLNEKSIQPVSFISKANTYYAISILYIVSVMPTLWNRVDLESTTLLSMLRAISLNMAVNPSNFLWALK